MFYTLIKMFVYKFLLGYLKIRNFIGKLRNFLP